MNAAAIGVDVGSTTWKAVAVDGDGRVLVSRVRPTNPRIEEQTRRELSELLAELGNGDGAPIGATGYGRKRVGAARSLTEITCHAKGAYLLSKSAGVLIDMGGQDTKIIRIGDGGEVLDFAMNDKCAAGTGRFLEIILGRLDVPLDDVAAYADRAETSVSVSSTCTVFAESEVISLVAEGRPLEGIVKGLHESLSKRVAALAGTVPNGSAIYMSGGVALNPAMVAALSSAMGRPIDVLPHPQLVGALGAALSVIQ
ncbi:MAG: acyl-CoA dehydratase activase [Deltaproteobacteria bacterium]|nr:acyl-CoA dehydratase activase [Deltaproteobacteria bacterium]